MSGSRADLRIPLRGLTVFWAVAVLLAVAAVLWTGELRVAVPVLMAAGLVSMVVAVVLLFRLRHRGRSYRELRQQLDQPDRRLVARVLTWPSRLDELPNRLRPAALAGVEQQARAALTMAPWTLTGLVAVVLPGVVQPRTAGMLSVVGPVGALLGALAIAAQIVVGLRGRQVLERIDRQQPTGSAADSDTAPPAG